jgi:hypothetical protein
MLNPVSKLLIGSGIVLILIGLFWQFGGKSLHLGRLPGDIVIEKENFKFYFPVVTSLLISGLLSLIFYLFRHFR